jgi:F0F1-type ATP synthase assembly protein I
LPKKEGEKGKESMPEEKRKVNRDQFATVGGILMLSAWGFAMVLSSFLFLYIGYLVDEILGTTPNFMLGSFFLAIALCIWKLYQEAWKKRKDV